MEEDEVYVESKEFLRGKGWTLLGGQPPSGCDHLPVIEVKWVNRIGLGSKGAYKPDLVCYRLGVFLLVECKPLPSNADASKLREILSTPDRISALHLEMVQRNLLARHHIAASSTEFRSGLRGALANAGSPVPLPDLTQIRVHEQGNCQFVAPTQADSLLLRALGIEG